MSQHRQLSHEVQEPNRYVPNDIFSVEAIALHKRYEGSEIRIFRGIHHRVTSAFLRKMIDDMHIIFRSAGNPENHCARCDDSDREFLGSEIGHVIACDRKLGSDSFLIEVADFADQHQTVVKVVSAVSSESAKEFVKALNELAASIDVKTEAIERHMSRVYTFSRTQDGIHPVLVGEVGEADRLERGNYQAEELSAFDAIVGSLSARNPPGRLAILSGEPGSGKSYFVRGIISEARGCVFVVISPSLIQELAGPELIPALMSIRSHNLPTVLIVEDAEQVLASRMSDNISAISSILNLADGIIGEMADVRIIATTNADKMDLDRAVVRPGRLLRAVEIRRLPQKFAEDILVRLLGDTVSPDDISRIFQEKHPKTLSDVYSIARSRGWKPPKSDAPDAGDGGESVSASMRRRSQIGFLPNHIAHAADYADVITDVAEIE